MVFKNSASVDEFIKGFGDLILYEASVNNIEAVKRYLQDASEILIHCMKNDKNDIFNSLLKQIDRVVRDNHSPNRQEYSRECSKAIIIPLKDVLSEDKHAKYSGYIKGILYSLYRHCDLSIRDDYPNSTATHYWYFGLVFRYDVQPRLEYLSMLDEALFENLKLVIKHKKSKLFDDFVFNCIHINEEDYAIDILINNYLNEEALALSTKAEFVHSVATVSNWLEEFGTFATKVKMDLRDISDIRESIIHRYLFHNFRENLFYIGAFCLFKGQADLIHDLWYKQQPDDADATWSGANIMPSIETIIEIYTRTSNIDKKYWRWEDRHDSRIYLDRYFLLLLLHHLKPDLTNTLETNRKVDVPIPVNLDGISLNNLHYYLSNLEEEVHFVVYDQSTLNSLRLPVSPDHEGFLLEVINDMQKSVMQRLDQIIEKKPIDDNVVEKRKDQIKRSFTESTFSRKLFALNHCLEHKDLFDNGPKSIPEFSTIISKEAFFDRWFVHYDSVFSSLGQHAAKTEDFFVLKRILMKCREIDLRASLEETISNFNLSDNMFIVAPYDVISSLRTSEAFERIRLMKLNTPFRRMPAIFGVFTISNIAIPVLRSKNINDQILLLDFSRLGTLRIPPRSDDPRVDITPLEDIIGSIPEKFKKQYESMDDKGKQNFLKSQVLIEISSTFQFEPAEDFWGYSITIPSDDEG